MKVPSKILRIWRKEAKASSLAQIARETNLNVRTVHRAVREGVCSSKTYEDINNFLEVRRNRREVFVKTFRTEEDGN